MQTVRLACHTMATRFELVLHGENPHRLRAAGEEALREIERLNAKLSLYEPTSEVAHINKHAAHGPVRVSHEVAHVIERARGLTAATNGAFDISVAPLMRCWGFVRGTGRLPTREAVVEAQSVCGMEHVLVDLHEGTVQFDRPGVMLDFGSLGKGYAVEQAVLLLRENGITSALLHGGTSTVMAIGSPPGEQAWIVAIPHPDDAATDGRGLDTGHEQGRVIATVRLRDQALSVSGVWGKSFEQDGRTYGHVIDPRTGAPTQGAVMAAVTGPSAADTDALSTALLVHGEAGAPLLQSFPDCRGLVALRHPEHPQGVHFLSMGLELVESLRRR